MNQKDLKGAFSYFATKRIIELEIARIHQPIWQQKEAEYSSLKAKIMGCLTKHNLASEFKELLNLHESQACEMYNAIYCQGFNDALQLPNLTAKLALTNSEVRDEENT